MNPSAFLTRCLGVALIAYRPCGRVAGLIWTDSFRPSEVDEKEREWKALGLDVHRVLRYENDPWPEHCCRSFEPCECRDKRSER